MRPGISQYPRPDCANADQCTCPRGTNPGRTYRFYNGKAVVPFGYGLSYTSFAYNVTTKIADTVEAGPDSAAVSLDRDGKWVAHPGEFGVRETAVHGQGFHAVKLIARPLSSSHNVI